MLSTTLFFNVTCIRCPACLLVLVHTLCKNGGIPCQWASCLLFLLITLNFLGGMHYGIVVLSVLLFVERVYIVWQWVYTRYASLEPTWTPTVCWNCCHKCEIYISYCIFQFWCIFPSEIKTNYQSSQTWKIKEVFNSLKWAAENKGIIECFLIQNIFWGKAMFDS